MPHLLPSFPDHWGYRRVAECKVACYACILGIIVFVAPHSLSWDIYLAFGGANAAKIIGLIAMTVAAMHSWALWLNGRWPPMSRRVRMTACLIHGVFLGFFMWWFFLESAYWHALLMAYVLTDVYFALHRACNPEVAGRL